MRSMTGYGMSDLKLGQYHLSLELKSVNSRYFEVSHRPFPHNLTHLEHLISKVLKEKLVRGKVNVYFRIEKSESSFGQGLDFQRMLALHEALARFSEENNFVYEKKVETLLAYHEMFTKEEDKEREVLQEGFLIALDEAISKLLESQQKEGATLKEDIFVKIERLEEFTNELLHESENYIKDYEMRLKKHFKEFMELDNAQERILMEVALLIEKSTIDEELTRLKSHFESLKLMLEEAVVGRKMDFMLQEINREINTVGSKIQTISLSKIVVDMKTIIENIREQVQNVV